MGPFTNEAIHEWGHPRMGPSTNGAIHEWLGLFHLEWVLYSLEKASDTEKRPQALDFESLQRLFNVRRRFQPCKVYLQPGMYPKRQLYPMSFLRNRMWITMGLSQIWGAARPARNGRVTMPNLFETGFCMVAAEFIRWRRGCSPLLSSLPRFGGRTTS
jgi:hypothetical protein